MKPTLKRLANLLVLAVLLLSQFAGSAPRATVLAQGTTYSISGRVTDGSGNGVGGVTVFATEKIHGLFLPLINRLSGSGILALLSFLPEPRAAASFSTTTDEAGSYTFADLPAQPYKLWVEKDSIPFLPVERIANPPDGSNQNFQVEILAPVIAPITEVISEETNQRLVSISPDGAVFTFSQATPQLLELAPGDIMVSDVAPAAPNGYLRKVSSVGLESGAVEITTEPATLEEAVQDGAIYFAGALDPAQVTQTRALPGVTFLPATDSSPFSFSYEVDNVVIYDEDGDPLTSDDQVKARGTIGFELDYEFFLTVRGQTVSNLVLAERSTISDTLEVYSEIELLGLEKETILARHVFTPLVHWIGIVPVVFVPCLDVVVGADGSVSVGISTSVSHELSLRAGVEYVNPAGWMPINELTDQYTFTMPHWTLEAKLKGYFGLRFNLYLYGVAGPFVKVTPFLELQVKPLETPLWILYGGIEVPAGFRVIDEIQEIGEWFVLKLDDYEVLAINMKEVIAQAESENHPPHIPLNPAPADGVTSENTNPTLSWVGGDPDGDMVVYDVFFEAGDASPDVLASENQAAISFTPGSLAPFTTYYWQINATDIYGWSTAGPVWSFTTGDGSITSGEMVTIPAGTFQMGCDPDHHGGYFCDSDEQPLHTVYLDEYRIDKYEVTNAQYAQCVAAGSCAVPQFNSSYSREFYYDTPIYADYPVIWISWNDAANYCTWTGKRLPTEAEWEKAARGASDTRIFPWGDASPACDLVNFFDYGIRYCEGDTRAVGSYLAGASPYGALDMAGNVFEWVNDWYQSGYYSISPTSNPQGPDSGTSKVLRGGSWMYYDYLLRVAHREYYIPTNQDNHIGFRCAAPPGISTPGAFEKTSPTNGATNQPTSLTLDWADSSGATSYAYCYDTSNDGACSNWTSAGATSQASISGLGANTTYYWQARATNSAGTTYANGIATAFWRFTTGDGSITPGEMVTIPAGTFQMGCDPAHNGGYTCEDEELPLHTVYLDAYSIDQYEVTNAQYAQCVAAGSCAPPGENVSYTRDPYYDNPAYASYPVVWVSWYNATDYCAWAGRRLPTEAEWEKAARGASDTRAYPWGDASPTCNLANFYDLTGSGIYCIGDTSTVGGFPAGASPYGALDMAGNVWEWVNDWWQLDYYSVSPASNPQGPESGTDKMMRGASFHDEDFTLRSVVRGLMVPTYRDLHLGFRCAASPEN